MFGDKISYFYSVNDYMNWCFTWNINIERWFICIKLIKMN
jgi:hypothetical protein